MAGVKVPRMLELALRESRKSTYKHKIGVIISMGKRVLSRGHNEVRYRSVGTFRYTKWDTSLHAERMACSALPKESLKGATIWIAREFVNGEYALAKPCDQCRRLIEDMGLSRIVYSIPDAPYYEIVKL